MAQAIFYALNGIVLIAVLSSFVFWIRWLLNRYHSAESQQPLVPLSPREKPRWTVGEFLLMFGMLIIAFSVLSFAAINLGWLERPAAAIDPGINTGIEATGDEADPDTPSMLPMLVINTLAGMIAMGVTLLWLKLVPRCSQSHLGLQVQQDDVVLGLKGALWFIPPVLLISLLASTLIPYEHPVLDTLANTKVPGTWVMLFVSTAIIVPVIEEFMFRVMLQGGLQRLADPLVASDDDRSAAEFNTIDVAKTFPATENELADAYRPPQPLSIGREQADEQTDAWQPRATWPIVVTSVFFALMHLGQGAAPIPLFFLSLGLGYLYRQSGRITAPLIVHMILNGLTLAVEFSRVAAAAP